MREWAGNTADRILSLKATRVLEIGCGTGLLVTRLAAHHGVLLRNRCLCCRSPQSGESVETGSALRHVTVQQRTADDFDGFEAGQFDAVILNSVVQYFPSASYLVRVLEGAAQRSINGRGTIFVGDVRNLLLLRAIACFHRN